MANEFVNAKHVKAFLVDMLDAAPYLKASKAHFAGQWKGKKGGKAANGIQGGQVMYLVDAGNPTDGLTISENDDASVQEREVLVFNKHKKTIVNLDVLQENLDIENFENEIGEPFGTRLGAELQKDIIEATYCNGCTGFVSDNGWSAMSKAGRFLRSIRQGAKVTAFIDPMAEGELTVDAINGWNFGPAGKAADFYGEASIGKFQQTDYVECTDLPQFTGVAVSTTVSSATPNNKGGWTITIADALSAALPAGYPLVLGSAFACNVVGMKTNTPFVMYLQKAAASGATTIDVGRIEMQDIGSRNCFISGTYDPDDPDGLLAGKTVTSLLAAGKKYYAVQHRVNDVLEFESVPMADLDGAKNASATISGIECKVTKDGDFDTMTNRTRWDIDVAYGIADNRLVSLAFIPAEKSVEALSVNVVNTSAAPVYTKAISG